MTEAVLDVSHRGRDAGELIAKREYFIAQQQQVTIPAKHRSLLGDLYVILTGWEGSGESATLVVYVNPLINWLWIGGFVFILGTVIAVWPTPQERRKRAPAGVSASEGAVPAG